MVDEVVCFYLVNNDYVIIDFVFFDLNNEKLRKLVYLVCLKLEKL